MQTLKREFKWKLICNCFCLMKVELLCSVFRSLGTGTRGRPVAGRQHVCVCIILNLFLHSSFPWTCNNVAMKHYPTQRDSVSHPVSPLRRFVGLIHSRTVHSYTLPRVSSLDYGLEIEFPFQVCKIFSYFPAQLAP